MSEIPCPLCRKLNDASILPEGEVVWEFPHGIAFLGEWQYYAGYCVLVSRVCAQELSRLQDDQRRAFLDEMCLLARAIEISHRPHKMNHELLGNQVPHLHWHLFPRSLNDPERLKPVWLALDDPARQEALRGDGTKRGETALAIRAALLELGAPRG